MKITHSGMITLCGRPNVGKSTLLNAFVGEKIAIVSNKPQTTRNRITGIVTRGENQYVFLDTPGLHKARNRLGEYMVGVVRASVADVDAVLLVVDPVANVGEPEMQLIERIKALKLPAVLVINKVDTLENKEKLLEVIAAYSAVHDMAEILREKLLYCLDKEIPHGTAVEITRFSERDSEIIDVEATIFCEKASHKGIIIGKGGAMLKKISTMARKDMEHFMGTKVFLQTWVKVKENWRDSLAGVHNMGYNDED